MNKVDLVEYINNEMGVKRGMFDTDEQWEELKKDVLNSKHYEHYMSSLRFKTASDQLMTEVSLAMVKYKKWIAGYFIMALIVLILSLI